MSIRTPICKHCGRTPRECVRRPSEGYLWRSRYAPHIRAWVGSCPPLRVKR